MAQFVPNFRFLLDDLGGEGDEALQRRAMSALATLTLFCLKRARESAEFLVELRRWRNAMRSVLDCGKGGRPLTAVLLYVLQVTDVARGELGEFLEQEVGPDAENELMSTLDRMTREAKEQGRAEGRSEMLLKQLRARFGSLPEGVIARVQAAAPRELDVWAERILSASTLDDVLED